MPESSHVRWTDVPAEQITPSVVRRYITGDNVTVAQFRLSKGGVIPAHRHEQEQFTCVLSGALKFFVDGKSTLVQAGETIRLPGWVEHEVEVIDDAVVIDVFSPVRQDWLDGTDTYFTATRR
jgi:quercetin dioxygenase-like cupin family protein